MDAKARVGGAPETDNRQRQRHGARKQVALVGSPPRGSAVEPVVGRRTEKVERTCAVVRDLRTRALAHGSKTFLIGHRVDGQHGHGERQAHGDCPRGAMRSADVPQDGDDAEPGHQEDPVIDAAEDLAGRERPHLEMVRRPVTLSGTMPGQDGQRNPERELQLEVVEVLHPVRRKREHQSAQQPGGITPGEVPNQPVGRHAAGHKRREKGEVIDKQGADAQPVKRRDDKRPGEHRVGIGQCRGFRKKDIRVKQPARVVAYLVGDPGQPPDREEGIAVLTDRRVERPDQRV